MHPAVDAVVAAQPVARLERRAAALRAGVGLTNHADVIGVDEVEPALAELVLQAPAGEAHVGGVEERALEVGAGRPHQDRGGVREIAKAPVAVAGAVYDADEPQRPALAVAHDARVGVEQAFLARSGQCPEAKVRRQVLVDQQVERFVELRPVVRVAVLA